jgi:hypothetical protein
MRALLTIVILAIVVYGIFSFGLINIGYEISDIESTRMSILEKLDTN